MSDSDPAPTDELLEQAQRLVQNMARECLGTRARILSRSITRIFDERFREFDVTGAQLYLIGAIGYFGPASPIELARSLSMDKSTLSRNLQRLAERQWVEVRNATSGRGQVVELAPGGADLLVRIQPSWAKAQEEVQELLGGEEADFLRVLGNRVYRREHGEDDSEGGRSS